MKLSKVKTKFLVGALSCALLVPIIPIQTFADSKTDCNKCISMTEEQVNQQYGKINKLDVTANLGLEIANSDLEKKAIITENGYVKNYYNSALEAHVSEEAFNAFNSSLDQINEAIYKGQISVGNTLLDIKFNENVNTRQKRAMQTYFISHDKAVKAQKLIAVGAGIAALGAELGIPAVVAGALALLAATTGLCDWNDKGFYLVHHGGTSVNCFAKN